jgi:CheY-like chemotaxis protein
MPGETILVVDDEPVNLELARVLVQLEGYDVRLAPNAREALTVLMHYRPRLLLMDLHMPAMDGLELARRLKADPVHRHAVIIALTASAMKGDEQRRWLPGATGRSANRSSRASSPASWPTGWTLRVSTRTGRSSPPRNSAG